MITRQEWFDKQTKKIQKQFKKNCDTLNNFLLFEDWVNDNDPYTPGIHGAFPWSYSKQGLEYWIEINKKYNDTTTIPKTTK